MRNRNILFISLLLFFCVNFVSAFTYDVTGINYLTDDGYEGGDGEFEAVITSNSSNVCDIICSWETDNYNGNIGNPEELSEDGESKRFSFRILLDGINGDGSDTLRISCERVTTYYCWTGSDETNFEQETNFEFDWNGDKECQYDNDVNPEDCFSAETDCVCSSITKCKEDLTRIQDLMGCTTYCGNGEAEEEYETCSNCQKDVGKCDGLSCSEGNECEGTYCVHEICASTPWIEGDGFCTEEDMSNGENCKNSEDCFCESNERCSSLGVCETYCGNGICENSEVGFCKNDCDWCGDGECQKSEDCSTCSSDCGVCENEEIKTEIVETAKEAVKETISESKTNQNKVIISGILVITLILVGYLGFKFIKLKKPKKKAKKKNVKKATTKKITKKKSKK